MKPFRSNMKIRSRIMLYSGIIVIVLVVCFMVFNLYATTRSMKAEAERLILVKLETMSDELETAVKEYSRPLYSIYVNDELKDLLYPQTSRRTSMFLSISTLRTFPAILRGTYSIKPRLYIYVDESTGFEYYVSGYYRTSEVENEEWYKEIKEATKQAVLYHVEYPEGGKALLTAAVKMQHSNGVWLGAARLTVSFEDLFLPLSDLLDVRDGAVCLYDSDNRIIYKSGTGLSDEQIELAAGGLGGFSYGGKTYRVFSEDIEKYGWKLRYIASEDSLIQGRLDRIQVPLLFSLLLAALSAGLMLLFSRLMTARLVRLTENVESLKVDDPDIRLDESLHGNDEVGVLTSAFENTILQIRSLTEHNSRIQKERYAIEYQALQEQVSPHFLNNSLSAVSAMAVDIGAYDIRDALLSIAKFYRLSLSHGASLITVSDEIEILKQYINICRLRFGDRISLSLSVSEDTLNYYTPKIVIQPFVENSIMHGLRTNGEDYREDIVSIGVEHSGDELLFTIDDNGRGMDEQTLRRILNSYEGEKRHAIGNVNKRIKLYFGEEYGVSITSTPGFGTSVCIRIPAISDPDKYRNI